MKVIAVTSPRGYNNHFLIQASEYELKEILGNRYTDTKVDIGSEIPVGKIYNYLIKMREQRVELEKAARILHTAAELLEMQIPTVTSPMEEGTQ